MLPPHAQVRSPNVPFGHVVVGDDGVEVAGRSLQRVQSLKAAAGRADAVAGYAAAAQPRVSGTCFERIVSLLMHSYRAFRPASGRAHHNHDRPIGGLFNMHRGVDAR